VDKKTHGPQLFQSILDLKGMTWWKQIYSIYFFFYYWNECYLYVICISD